MLNAYVKRPLTRERYRSRPAGPHLDAFILWLEQRGYQPRRILRLMRGVHRFSQWAQENGLGVEELAAQALAQFHDHLQGRQPLRGSRSNGTKNNASLAVGLWQAPL
jgi:hypothetical protein